MKLKPACKPFVLLLCLLTLSACVAGSNPDYGSKVAQEQAKIAQWSDLDGAQSITIIGDLIQSDELDSLVEKGLAANPGLAQTLLTLKIRQAEYRQTQGARLPEMSAGFSALNEEDQEGVYTGTATVSWELDLWRKVADSSKAASKDVAEQQMLYQSARDTLAAEIMTGWLKLTSAKKNIAIEQERIDVLEKTENYTRQRYRSGLGTLEDLDSARSAVASARATLEEYKETLAQQQRALATLLGNPGADISMAEEYTHVIVPLADLPQQTLQRRPDLKAAFLAIESAGLNADVAYKDLLPSISLEASLEDIASTPGSALFTSSVWSLLGQLTAPLFQGGQLKAQARIADLETAQAFETYRETLYTAVQEIEDAMGLERSLGKQQTHIEIALAAAADTLVQYQKSYRQGLSDMLDLLTVQTQTFDLTIQLNTLKYERLANRITLGLALGIGAK
ncbi:TolC family protein [Desulfobacter hydrogenophilus]|uniref:TolC family protein n=1 Tax=Desulfobacter hydrogenophilus TaxID=2291 RepID=A0A328FC16_9BACT|nr:TolC family protein [Desulfobacter hydrogenophilus]NDY72229.1 TolC family protein [Desulfobacter hydrogenophilus]QBH15089.1 TolC family protein [Desulfobacter hydrogenophilus]RAM02234.1 TolC family protein [Desulfobacter hydrogenophilus]